MSNHTRKHSRRKMAAKVALVALTMGGGLAIGYAKQNPSLLSAQTAGPAAHEARVAPAGPTVTIYKSPTCTCCAKWGDHLREAGFAVREVIRDDVSAVMDEHGVPMHLRSCHLGVVGGYVVVGHVPGDLVARLLEDQPELAGIAVPGMPRGSPGMESFTGRDRYDVIAFGPDGVEHVFATR